MPRFCLALALSLTASLASAGDSITVWWAQWAPSDGLQQLGDDFAKETGIAVKVHQIPWSNFQDQVFLDFGNAKTSFDAVVGDSQWIGRGASKGLYLDLTAWLPGAVDMAALHPKALANLCEYPAGSKKYFAAPLETDACGFAYRRDWFQDPAEQAAFKAKFGRDLAVPATWEEFRDIASFFQRPDKKRFGCAILTGRGYDSLVMGYQNFLWSFGGGWGDPATFATDGHVNSPSAVAGLEFMKSLLAYAPAGAANFDYVQCLESFTNGSTAMMMDYFAFFPGVARSMGDKAGFFAMPGHAGRRACSLGGQGFSISAKTSPAKQDAAKRFIAWFLQEKQQQAWIRKEGGFTANAAILKSPAFRSATPYNAALADSIDMVQDFWNVPVYNELLAAAQRHLGEALDGTKPAKAALDALAEEHAGIFAEAGLAK
ncbi:MAG: extracellular solute-binding protein [Planctomycetes bacterium]|nr:extracellular solute-binding protein [Planctomycetota bacterium]